MEEQTTSLTDKHLTGKKILVVEDDDTLSGVYVEYLRAEGFEAKRVSSGEDALTVALEFRPDLVLLDAMMPKISGFDVLEILRKTPQTARVKIIMLTALSQESDEQKARELGVDDYLVKSRTVVADVVECIGQHLK